MPEHRLAFILAVIIALAFPSVAAAQDEIFSDGFENGSTDIWSNAFEGIIVVISEIMRDPAAVLDSAGEWFEVYNPTSISVNMNGWTIRDNDSDVHVIAAGGPLLLEPGEYLVLGAEDDPSINGGVQVDYEYGYADLVLSNSDDELVLVDVASKEIDRVEWNSDFPNQSGASMYLVSSLLNPVENDYWFNWHDSTTPYGDGDLGTPGIANPDY